MNPSETEPGGPGRVPLHVEVHGDGPVLVLGHGFGGSARNFRPQLRALRDRYRVAVFDARGHARSGAPGQADAYRPECFVADVGRVLDRAGAAGGIVGGLSMGAAVALRFAREHPARVRGLVLASFPDAGGGLAGVAREFADSLDREGLESAGARFVWGDPRAAESPDAPLIRQGFLEHSPEALAHTLRGLIALQPPAARLAAELGEFEIPVLLIAGERDTASLAASRALDAALPNSRLVVVAGAGHVVNLVRPREFNAALLEFLEANAG